MQKFLVTGIGILLISGAFVFVSDAQTNSCGCFTQKRVDLKTRYVSRGCCADAKRPTRPFSNRIGPWQHRSKKSQRNNTNNCSTCNTAVNDRYMARKDANLYGQYRGSRLTRAQKIAYQRRIFGESNGGRSLNTVVSDRNVIRNNNFVYKSGIIDTHNQFAQAQPQNFAITIPSNFGRTNGVYRTTNSSLAFRVVSGGKCNAIAFNDCTRRLEKKFQEDNHISQVYGEQTFTRWNQTVLSDLDYFQTVTKSYGAYSGGRYNNYFTFTALDPSTNQIVRIEGVSTNRDGANAAQQAYGIFESFRFRT